VRSIVFSSIIDMEIHFSLIDHYTIGKVLDFLIKADYLYEAKD
jgi:hypothetical protein